MGERVMGERIDVMDQARNDRLAVAYDNSDRAVGQSRGCSDR
jgi:hypothetical protein